MANVTVTVYLRGGGQLFGEMTEEQVLQLVDKWSDRTWDKQAFSLKREYTTCRVIGYVLFEEVAAIDYSFK